MRKFLSQSGEHRMVRQVREMGDVTYNGLSEETKIKMHNQQFIINEDEWDEVWEWILSNTQHPYYYERINGVRYIQFYKATDATGFKLRWHE